MGFSELFSFSFYQIFLLLLCVWPCWSRHTLWKITNWWSSILKYILFIKFSDIFKALYEFLFKKTLVSKKWDYWGLLKSTHFWKLPQQTVLQQSKTLLWNTLLYCPVGWIWGKTTRCKCPHWTGVLLPKLGIDLDLAKHSSSEVSSSGLGVMVVLGP